METNLATTVIRSLWRRTSTSHLELAAEPSRSAGSGCRNVHHTELPVLHTLARALNMVVQLIAPAFVPGEIRDGAYDLRTAGPLESMRTRV